MSIKSWLISSSASFGGVSLLFIALSFAANLFIHDQEVPMWYSAPLCPLTIAPRNATYATYPHPSLCPHSFTAPQSISLSVREALFRPGRAYSLILYRPAEATGQVSVSLEDGTTGAVLLSTGPITLGPALSSPSDATSGAAATDAAATSPIARSLLKGGSSSSSSSSRSSSSSSLVYRSRRGPAAAAGPRIALRTRYGRSATAAVDANVHVYLHALAPVPSARGGALRPPFETIVQPARPLCSDALRGCIARLLVPMTRDEVEAASFETRPPGAAPRNLSLRIEVTALTAPGLTIPGTLFSNPTPLGPALFASFFTDDAASLRAWAIQDALMKFGIRMLLFAAVEGLLLALLWWAEGYRPLPPTDLAHWLARHPGEGPYRDADDTPVIEVQLENGPRLTSLVTAVECGHALERITRLSLRNNVLERLEGLHTLRRLRALVLRSNNLRALDGIEAAPQLRLLDVADNNLLALGPALQLPELAYLDAWNNDLDGTVGPGLPSVLWLNLKHNNIRTIARGLAPRARFVDVSSNELRGLDGLRGMRHAETLLVGANHIAAATDVSPLFAELPALTFIDVNDNNLTGAVCEALRRDFEAPRPGLPRRVFRF